MGGMFGHGRGVGAPVAAEQLSAEVRLGPGYARDVGWEFAVPDVTDRTLALASGPDRKADVRNPLVENFCDQLRDQRPDIAHKKPRSEAH